STVAVSPADAAREERKYRSQDRSQQSLSLDGRNTGRPRTCGHDSFGYDGWEFRWGPIANEPGLRYPSGLGSGPATSECRKRSLSDTLDSLGAWPHATNEAVS